jgi:hypothetical protein
MKATAAIILKCSICGEPTELEPKPYSIPEGDILYQRRSVIQQAQEDVPKNPSFHCCNADRVYGVFKFAGVKIYRIAEE